MPFFVIKKGLVLLEWKYFPTPKILDPNIFTYLEIFHKLDGRQVYISQKLIHFS